MAISNISYSNTFGQWLVSTNQTINEVNTLQANNYTKSSGTLFLDSSAVGLSVSNNSLFSGNTTFTGGTAKNLSVYVPSYLYQTLNITANSSIVASGNVSISGIFTGIGSGLTALNANNISSGVLSITNGGTGLSAAGANGQILSSDGGSLSWIYPATGLPTQTANTGKFLTTDGINPSWAAVSVGQNGVLTNSNTVSANLTVGNGLNALSVGPITVANGVIVTVTPNHRWVII